MSTSRFELIIEGKPEEDGYVRVSDFLTGIQSFVGTMKTVDQLETGAKSPSFYLLVVGLSLASPARVTFDALPKNDVDVRNSASGHLLRVIDNIEEERGIALDDYALLENLNKLVLPVGKSVAALKVVAQGRTVNLSGEFQQKVGRMMAAEEVFPGQLTGMLEYINVHGDTRSFRIYPDVGPGHVNCVFPKDMTGKAVGAILRYVGVWGNLRQRKAARYPYAIEVEHIEIFPPDKELPRLSDLYGIAPNATGKLTSEEFIWSIRGTLE